MSKVAVTAVPLLSAIAERWSPRSFAPTPVPREDLLAIVEAARWAPSSYNEQPWRFVVTRSGEPAYDKLFDSLVEWNRQWVEGAPVLILSMAATTYRRNGKPNRHAGYDTGMAVMSMVIEARARGLYAHQMGGYEDAKAREAFGIPDDVETIAAITLGYLGEPEALPTPEFREMEVQPRSRAPLSNIIFGARYGVASSIADE